MTTMTTMTTRTSAADGAEVAFLAERRASILERVRRACERVGREVSEIELVCVTKGHPAAVVAAAAEAGWGVFAENRVPELVGKWAELAELGLTPPVDMIGNLQTNKLKALAGKARCVQSVSSLHVAEALSARSLAAGVPQRALLEVNVSGEASKQGFSEDELMGCAEELAALPGLAIEGLMTMAPAGDAMRARETFRAARALATSLERNTSLTLPVLSAGMSDDFEIAIEEGSTMVRIGRVALDRAYTPTGAR